MNIFDINKTLGIMTIRYYSALLLICVFFSSAQTIRINEVVSSNSVYLDEDGDTPDWFELHNYGTQNVSLENWNITDDSNELDKWSFPSVILQPNEYLLVWASGKDRSINTFSRTLVNQGDVFKYNIPNNEPDTNWKNLNFDSSLWSNGSSGFGYGDGDDNTSIPNGTLSVYLRKTFSVNDLENLISLILDIDYDDAFVAYINGIEICRANINGVPPPFDSNDINTDHEA